MNQIVITGKAHTILGIRVQDFRVCLDTVYFIEIEKLLREDTVDKGKIQLKQYSGAHEQCQKVQ